MKEEAACPEASAGNAASERRLGTPLFFLSSSFAAERRPEGSGAEEEGEKEVLSPG